MVTNGYTLTDEDVQKIRRFKEIMDRGFYVSGQEVTDLHNKVLGTRLASTNCSSCIRTRITALVQALAKFEKDMAKDEENKALESPTPQEDMKARMQKVRAARGKNKK